LSAIPESHGDLLDADVAILATIGSDGRPQLSGVWFLAEGDAVSVSLNTTRQKTKNLVANPASTLFILDRENPYRYQPLRPAWEGAVRFRTAMWLLEHWVGGRSPTEWWARGDLNSDPRRFGWCWIVPTYGPDQGFRGLGVPNDVDQIYPISTRPVEIR
jgi:Pyridoxamine 5'-phosphate oxidase